MQLASPAARRSNPDAPQQYGANTHHGPIEKGSRLDQTKLGVWFYWHPHEACREGGVIMATENPGSGERRAGEVHQETTTGEGNYHSRDHDDGGRVISVGENANHTSFSYDANGEFEGSKSRGDGGTAKDAKP